MVTGSSGATSSGGSGNLAASGAGSGNASTAGTSAVGGSAGALSSSAGGVSIAGVGGAANAGAANGGTATGGGGVGNEAGTSGTAGASASSVSFISGRVTVTGVRGTAAPAASATIALHNAATTAVQVNGLVLGGADAAQFKLSKLPTFPTMLAPGADLAISVELSTTGASLPKAPANKDTGCVLLTANLTATLASDSAVAAVYGLLLTQANYEPTLGQILTTLGYKLNVGKAQDNWNPNQSMTAASLPALEPGTDEVAASRFIKAGSGNVGLSLVARFSPIGPLPYGYYTTMTGCEKDACPKVGTMAKIEDAQTSSKARMVNPPPGTGSMSTFDPGSTPFGLWVYSDQKTQMFDSGNAVNGDYNYSQDALNAPVNVHRFKSYPLKDTAGVTVPHTYLVAIEEAGNGDYQDYVFLLSNVTAMP
jgi:hypothetical protein